MASRERRHLRQQITGDGTAATEAAGDGAEGDASAGPSPVTADDQTRTSTPVVSSPVARTTSAPPAAAHEDSINLVRLVGPAILKRVVPIAVAVAALVLLGRRLRHVFRRGAKK